MLTLALATLIGCNTDGAEVADTGPVQVTARLTPTAMGCEGTGSIEFFNPSDRAVRVDRVSIDSQLNVVGHETVMRSVLEPLEKLVVPVSWMPTEEGQVSGDVLVNVAGFDQQSIDVAGIGLPFEVVDVFPPNWGVSEFLLTETSNVTFVGPPKAVAMDWDVSGLIFEATAKDLSGGSKLYLKSSAAPEAVYVNGQLWTEWYDTYCPSIRFTTEPPTGSTIVVYHEGARDIPLLAVPDLDDLKVWVDDELLPQGSWEVQNDTLHLMDYPDSDNVQIGYDADAFFLDFPADTDLDTLLVTIDGVYTEGFTLDVDGNLVPDVWPAEGAVIEVSAEIVGWSRYDVQGHELDPATTTVAIDGVEMQQRTWSTEGGAVVFATKPVGDELRVSYATRKPEPELWLSQPTHSEPLVLVDGDLWEGSYLWQPARTLVEMTEHVPQNALIEVVYVPTECPLD
jgi:hypothetical protein